MAKLNNIMYIKMFLRINNRKIDDQGPNKPTIHIRIKNAKEYNKASPEGIHLGTMKKRGIY